MVGMALNTATVGNPVGILVSGSISLPSTMVLIPGSPYYLGSNGAMSTVVSPSYVGWAMSSSVFILELSGLGSMGPTGATGANFGITGITGSTGNRCFN